MLAKVYLLLDLAHANGAQIARILQGKAWCS